MTARREPSENATGGWWSGSLKVFHTQDEYEEDVDLDLNASNNLKCPSLILMFWTLRILQTWKQLSRFFNLVSFLPMGRNLTSHIFLSTVLFTHFPPSAGRLAPRSVTPLFRACPVFWISYLPFSSFLLEIRCW